MQRSESIANIAKALCLVQAELKGAKKDSDNPFFKSKYADLESVWAACRQLLFKHGLSVSQFPVSPPAGVQLIPTGQQAQPDMIGLETILMHESGEYLAETVYVRPSKMDAQAAGSVITYLRRYGLQAVIGICPEDDDGNDASGRVQDMVAPATTPAPVNPGKQPAKATQKAPAKAEPAKPAIEPGSPAAMFIEFRASACKATGRDASKTADKGWFNDIWKAAAKDAGLPWNPTELDADQYCKVLGHATSLLQVTEGDKLPAPLPLEELPFEGIGPQK